MIRCTSHLQFIRGLECAIKGLSGHVCGGGIEAAHVRTETDGGMGMKPSDSFTIPLCRYAHSEQHRMGEPAFEKEYGIQMLPMAVRLWEISKAGIKYRRAEISPERTE